MQQARRGGREEAVGKLAEAVARLGERRLTWPVLCERAGVDHAVADPLWRALGFADVPPDEAVYTDDDVLALKIAAEGLERLSGEEHDNALDFIVREARVVSGHIARIAEAQVDALAGMEQLGLREHLREETLAAGIERSRLGWLLMYSLRRRVDETIRRRALTEFGDQPLLAVGFVDLVDFTKASSGLDTPEFGRLLERFEAIAWDEVTEAGGRLVKLIGDEAMFVCPPGASATQAALAILRRCAQEQLPAARAGIAVGPVLTRGGDYFGPVVNVASRLVDVADPGTAALDERAHERITKRDGMRVAGPTRKRLKGVGEIQVWRVTGEP